MPQIMLTDKFLDDAFAASRAEIKKILQKEPELICKLTGAGRSFLSVAYESGWLDLMNFILDLGLRLQHKLKPLKDPQSKMNLGNYAIVLGNFYLFKNKPWKAYLCFQQSLAYFEKALKNISQLESAAILEIAIKQQMIDLHLSLAHAPPFDNPLPRLAYTYDLLVKQKLFIEKQTDKHHYLEALDTIYRNIAENQYALAFSCASLVGDFKEARDYYNAFDNGSERAIAHANIAIENLQHIHKKTAADLQFIGTYAQNIKSWEATSEALMETIDLITAQDLLTKTEDSMEVEEKVTQPESLKRSRSNSLLANSVFSPADKSADLPEAKRHAPSMR